MSSLNTCGNYVELCRIEKRTEMTVKAKKATCNATSLPIDTPVNASPPRQLSVQNQHHRQRRRSKKKTHPVIQAQHSWPSNYDFNCLISPSGWNSCNAVRPGDVDAFSFSAPYTPSAHMDAIQIPFYYFSHTIPPESPTILTSPLEVSSSNSQYRQQIQSSTNNELGYSMNGDGFSDTSSFSANTTLNQFPYVQDSTINSIRRASDDNIISCMANVNVSPVSSPQESSTQISIMKQIQYYFSDENLRKDHFLVSSMDCDGWVSLALIMSFPKMLAILKHSGEHHVLPQQLAAIVRRTSTTGKHDLLDDVEVDASTMTCMESDCEVEGTATMKVLKAIDYVASSLTSSKILQARRNGPTDDTWVVRRRRVLLRTPPTTVFGTNVSSPPIQRRHTHASHYYIPLSSPTCNNYGDPFGSNSAR